MVTSQAGSGFLENMFKLKEHGSNVRTEIIAGITTLSVLLAALEEGFAQIERSDRNRTRGVEAATRLNVLTSREHEVLEGLVRGHPNKTIAYDLGISARTVEIHRANLMTKLNVRSLSEALRIAFAAGLGDAPAIATEP